MARPTLKMELHRILLRYFEDLATILLKIGAGEEYNSLLKSIGLEAEDFSQVPGRLTFDHYLSAIRILEDSARFPALGLRLGAIKRCGSFGFTGVAFLTQETMEQGNQFIGDMFEIVYGRYLRLNILKEGEWIFIRYEPSHPSVAKNASLNEQVLMTGVRVLSELLPKVDWSSCQARFAFSPPSYVDLYSRYIPFDYVFNQPHNELRVPASWGHLHSILAEENVKEFCESQFRDMLIEELGCAFLSRQLHSVLMDRQLERMPKLSEVADIMDIPERALRARLAQEGTSFRTVLSDVIVERAKQLLADPQMSVKAIAFKLGFSESPSFHRAFSRATGLTPEHYRSQFLKNQK